MRSIKGLIASITGKRKKTLNTKYLSHIPKNKGFTLIELMVAISIVAILSTIGMIMFSSAQGSARDAKRKGDLEDIKKALYQYKVATGSFCPGSPLSTCAVATVVNGGTTGAGFEGTAATSLKNTILPYLKQALHDPKCPAGTCATGWNDYYVSTAYDNFVLSAQLENAPSPAMTCTSGTLTGPFTSRTYCLSE